MSTAAAVASSSSSSSWSFLTQFLVGGIAEVLGQGSSVVSFNWWLRSSVVNNYSVILVSDLVVSGLFLIIAAFLVFRLVAKWNLALIARVSHIRVSRVGRDSSQENNKKKQNRTATRRIARRRRRKKAQQQEGETRASKATTRTSLGSREEQRDEEQEEDGFLSAAKNTNNNNYGTSVSSSSSPAAERERDNSDDDDADQDYDYDDEEDGEEDDEEDREQLRHHLGFDAVTLTLSEIWATIRGIFFFDHVCLAWLLLAGVCDCLLSLCENYSAGRIAVLTQLFLKASEPILTWLFALKWRKFETVSRRSYDNDDENTFNNNNNNLRSPFSNLTAASGVSSPNNNYGRGGNRNMINSSTISSPTQLKQREEESKKKKKKKKKNIFAGFSSNINADIIESNNITAAASDRGTILGTEDAEYYRRELEEDESCCNNCSSCSSGSCCCCCGDDDDDYGPGEEEEGCCSSSFCSYLCDKVRYFYHLLTSSKIGLSVISLLFVAAGICLHFALEVNKELNKTNSAGENKNMTMINNNNNFSFNLSSLSSSNTTNGGGGGGQKQKPNHVDHIGFVFLYAFSVIGSALYAISFGRYIFLVRRMAAHTDPLDFVDLHRGQEHNRLTEHVVPHFHHHGIRGSIGGDCTGGGEQQQRRRRSGSRERSGSGGERSSDYSANVVNFNHKQEEREGMNSSSSPPAATAAAASAAAGGGGVTFEKGRRNSNSISPPLRDQFREGEAGEEENNNNFMKRGEQEQEGEEEGFPNNSEDTIDGTFADNPRMYTEQRRSSLDSTGGACAGRGAGGFFGGAGESMTWDSPQQQQQQQAASYNYNYNSNNINENNNNNNNPNRLNENLLANKNNNNTNNQDGGNSITRKIVANLFSSFATSTAERKEKEQQQRYATGSSRVAGGGSNNQQQQVVNEALAVLEQNRCTHAPTASDVRLIACALETTIALVLSVILAPSFEFLPGNAGSGATSWDDLGKKTNAGISALTEPSVLLYAIITLVGWWSVYCADSVLNHLNAPLTSLVNQLASPLTAVVLLIFPVLDPTGEKVREKVSDPLAVQMTLKILSIAFILIGSVLMYVAERKVFSSSSSS